MRLPYNHTATSKEAAKRMIPHANRIQDRVYEFIVQKRYYGATNEEIAYGVDVPLQTICPRKVELEKKGLICHNGKLRRTRSGRRARVFIDSRIQTRNYT